MMYSNSVFAQGSSASQSSFAHSSTSNMASRSSSSSSFGYNGNDSTTNPFSSYQRHSSPSSSDSMLYYKDKPVHRPSRFLKWIQQLLNEPWNIVALLLLIGVIAGCSQRATKAWLLREFQSQSFSEAVSVWHEVQQDHVDLANEFEQLYRAQSKWEQRDLAWRTHMQRLHNFTQRESRRAVLDK
jgi:hypothetical protein